MTDSIPPWARNASRFLASMQDPSTGGFRSVPGGPATLYGTCYALLGRYYLGTLETPEPRTVQFILDGQDPDTGLFERPELSGFQSKPGVRHDREHLQWHLTCAAWPACLHFGIAARHPVRAAHRFADVGLLREWLARRDLKEAWFEGNNLLFAGQLLVLLRDHEHLPGAQRALEVWFQWLNETLDPSTGLWGTNGFCGPADAVYGGYHQLLVYYHEQRTVAASDRLVDTVLDLQHPDGGFNPRGNAGACEDVDSVDILVHAYKRSDYRRPEIRVALRRCLRHILATQNADGGFPYNRYWDQSHMGIPGTAAPGDVSTTFPTWFRIHTLALMGEVLPDEDALQMPFRFTRHLSMGWHPAGKGSPPALASADRWAEMPARTRALWIEGRHGAASTYRRTRQFGGRILRRLHLR